MVSQPRSLPPNAQPIPLTRQGTPDSCGAAAVRAVLRYRLGHDVPETGLVQQLGTTHEDGTAPWAMGRVLSEEFGLPSQLIEYGAIKDLIELLGSGDSAILDIQAWSEPQDQSKPWRERWEDGHYVVLVGIDQENIYVMDPSTEHSYGFIPGTEFQDRWHDECLLENGTLKRYQRLYIRIGGGSPIKGLVAPSQPLVYVA